MHRGEINYILLNKSECKNSPATRWWIDKPLKYGVRQILSFLEAVVPVVNCHCHMMAENYNKKQTECLHLQFRIDTISAVTFSFQKTLT